MVVSGESPCHYAVQPLTLDGLAQAFIIGESFIGDDDVCLVLGDNIFYGPGFSKLLQEAVTHVEEEQKASVFGYYVTDPERYGVAEFDADGNVISIEEKPETPKSNFAVVGLYFYPNSVVKLAHRIQPSERGELEITSVNEAYLKKSELKMSVMGRGFAWLDTGTQQSLLEASNYIEAIQNRQGLMVSCLEEIAWRKGWISDGKLREIAEPLTKNDYGKYLLRLLKR